ncbi:hypothetical protein AACH06_05485 [Ideonella sp. DXS29W]|uniref:Oligogalacturonate lyase domain-containing protein n=1 Tax=Ideonella lacteola TaxID=2984193 RepID=A0ABU9BME8_9BURK
MNKTLTHSCRWGRWAAALMGTCWWVSALAADGLCDGLVQDKMAHPMTALAKPKLGKAVTDPEFGTRIRRISKAGSGHQIVPAYSTIPAWNADESLLVLYHRGNGVPHGSGHHLYDGRTYAYLRPLAIDPPDIEQFFWHATDARLMLYVDAKNRLIQLDVTTNTKTVLKSFSCGGRVSGGGDVMYTSWDSDVIGLSCQGKGFSYRISTGSEGARVPVSGGLSPTASASGQWLFVPMGQQAQVRDLSMGLLRTIDVRAGEHASLGRLPDGTDTHNSVQFDGGTVGTLVVSDMTGAAAPRVVVGPKTGYPYPPTGTHVSAVALQRPGWVAVSVVGATSGKGVLDQELLLADTAAGGKVCRVGHHRSWADHGQHDYWAEPHAVISPSGTRVLFGSDWGNGNSVDTYVVELPSYRR